MTQIWSHLGRRRAKSRNDCTLNPLRLWRIQKLVIMLRLRALRYLFYERQERTLPCSGKQFLPGTQNSLKQMTDVSRFKKKFPYVRPFYTKDLKIGRSLAVTKSKKFSPSSESESNSEGLTLETQLAMTLA